jgi:hypothetical protein
MYFPFPSASDHFELWTHKGILQMKKYLSFLTVIVVFAAGIYVVVNWYPYIFAKSVDGVVFGVERVQSSIALLSDGSRPPAQVFSFAVAVKDGKTGEIFTASSEDRRWAVVQKGQCAEVKFLPYPFWSLSRSGAYFGARLIRLYECAGGNPSMPAATTPPPAAVPAPATPSTTTVIPTH